MRKTQIKPYKVELTKEQYHVIYFSSELKFKFYNKRTAELKANELNRYLTERLVTLNQCLVQAYTAYRSIYFMVPRYVGLQLENNIKSAEITLENALKLSDRTEGAHWCWVNTLKTIMFLNDTLTILHQQTSKRNLTSINWNLVGQLKLVQLVNDDLTNFHTLITEELKRTDLRTLKVAV